MESKQEPIRHYPIDGTKAHTWALHGPKGMVISINVDTGEYKFGENYTPTEGARIFWESVGRQIVELNP